MESQTRRFGHFFALAAFAGAAGYSFAQLLQLAGWLNWPWDEGFIYGSSLLIAWPFMLAMLALHRLTPETHRIWSGAGLLFATMYATYVVLMYAVQLGTAMPLRLAGTPNPLYAVDRFSLFWAIDGLGYICMGFATLMAAQALPARSWARRFFFANGVFTAVVAVIYFWPRFSTGLLLLGTPWIITAPGSILTLAFWFRNRS